TSKESSSFPSSRGPLAGTTPVVARVDGQPDLEPQLERLDLAAGTVRRPASAGGTGLDRGTPLPLARATSALLFRIELGAFLEVPADQGREGPEFRVPFLGGEPLEQRQGLLVVRRAERVEHDD